MNLEPLDAQELSFAEKKAEILDAQSILKEHNLKYTSMCLSENEEGKLTLKIVTPHKKASLKAKMIEVTQYSGLSVEII